MTPLLRAAGAARLPAVRTGTCVVVCSTHLLRHMRKFLLCPIRSCRPVLSRTYGVSRPCGAVPPVTRRRPGCARRRSVRNTVSWSAVERHALSPSCSPPPSSSAPAARRSAHGRPARPGAHPGHPRRPRPGAGRGPRRRPSASSSRRRRTPPPTAPSSAPTAPRTRCPPRRPAARRSSWRPGSTSSSRCRRPPTRSPSATASRTRRPAAASPRRSTSRSTAAGKRTMTLTSQYSWLYNQYPFTNDPNAGLLHPDWWITECGCVPAATTPDADDHQAVPAHALLRRAAPAARQDVPGRRQGPADRPGRHATPRGPSSTCSTPSWSALPHVRLERGERAALRRRPDRPAGLGRRVRQGDRVRAEASTCKVYVPPGTYQVNRHIIVDDVTIEGAGSWYTIIKGKRGRPGDARARRLGPHRRRLLRQGRGRRRQPQRAPVRLRDRG